MTFTVEVFITLTNMAETPIITVTNWKSCHSLIKPIRQQVFIDEQAVPEALEWDDDDQHAVHLLAQNTQLDYVATARLLPDGHIGRMAVLKAWRKQGIGTAMLSRLLQLCIEKNINAIVNAQIQARPFYQKAGFEIMGKEFMDAGIPHIKMIYQIQTRHE